MAETIMHKIGLISAETVRMFYSQICFRNKLFFKIKIPNAKTLKAMRDADDGKTQKARSVHKLFEGLN